MEKLILRLKTLYPRIKIVGFEESKFRDLNEKEQSELVNKIERRRSEIIFISLGSPKQEVFAYGLKKSLRNRKIIIPVGAAFDFISGNKKQAPLWMQKTGLEFFSRFIEEPKRLWKRYLFYGLFFIILIFVQKIKK